VSMSANLALPQTTSATVGVVTLGGTPFLHACCSSSASNTFVGVNAGNLKTTGVGHNTASGFKALFANTTGSENTATGYFALSSNTSGNSNTATGHEALIDNATGFNNTATGFSAMLSNGSGTDNTAMGDSVLNFNTTGSFNTAVGETALGSNTVGKYNTALGYAANVSSGNLTNATAIGVFANVGKSNALVLGCVSGSCPSGTTPPAVGIGTTTPFATLDVVAPDQIGLFVRGPESGVGAGLDLQTTGAGGLQWEILDTGNTSAQGPNKLNIRNVNTGNDVLTILASGAVGIETREPDNSLTVNGSADKPGGGSWGTFSDGRLKTVEGAYGAGLDAILKLTPVRYRYREQNAMGIKDGEEHVGFVAQDVQKVIPEAVTTNSRGYLLVNNDPILWTMLNAIKQQQQQIQRQQTRMAKLTRELQNVRQVQAENAMLYRELLRIAAEVQQIRTHFPQEQAQSAQVAAHAGGN
jgi:Chaperone of endosialidase